MPCLAIVRPVGRSTRQLRDLGWPEDVITADDGVTETVPVRGAVGSIKDLTPRELLDIDIDRLRDYATRNSTPCASIGTEAARSIVHSVILRRFAHGGRIWLGLLAAVTVTVVIVIVVLFFVAVGLGNKNTIDQLAHVGRALVLAVARDVGEKLLVNPCDFETGDQFVGFLVVVADRAFGLGFGLLLGVADAPDSIVVIGCDFIHGGSPFMMVACPFTPAASRGVAGLKVSPGGPLGFLT